MRNSLLYIIVGLLFVGYILLEVFGPPAHGLVAQLQQRQGHALR